MTHVSDEGPAVALRWGGDSVALIEFKSRVSQYRDASDPNLASDHMVEYTVRLSANELAPSPVPDNELCPSLRRA